MKLIKVLMGLQAEVGDGNQDEKEGDKGNYLKQTNVEVSRLEIKHISIKKFLNTFDWTIIF